MQYIRGIDRDEHCFVQGMIEAFREHAQAAGFDVRFDTTIPAGAPTCHFTMWRATPGEAPAWSSYTDHINQKALEHAQQARTAAENPPSA